MAMIFNGNMIAEPIANAGLRAVPPPSRGRVNYAGRRFLVILSSLIGATMLPVVPAFPQSAASPAAQPSAAAMTAALSPASKESVEEIVVTAQKREQLSQ